eukprot:3482798-Prymnesium_polylepis.2
MRSGRGCYPFGVGPPRTSTSGHMPAAVCVPVTRAGWPSLAVWRSPPLEPHKFNVLSLVLRQGQQA